jgi:protoporphyrin/coproporphyrin ferrochelatase
MPIYVAVCISSSMNSTAKAAILLVNLGTPSAPTTAAVRRFLAEFLSDPRVIELPRALWLPILYGVILPLRPRRSAQSYQKVWTDQGSPLMVYSRALTSKLAEAIQPASAGIRVELAMRYGEPNIAAAIDRLHNEGVRRLLVLPLYPQYSAASTGSTFDATIDALKKLRWSPELRFVGDYHANENYISALADRVEKYWHQHGRAPKLLLSFHGIPQKCIAAGDPYFDHCTTTARLLRERLKLNEEDCLLSFQSRVGRERWLSPYTDEVLKQLPRDGVRHVQVVCPGFAVDCLETLEEIAIRGREQFVEAGGERLDYIPALNADQSHIAALMSVIRDHTQGWPEFDALRSTYSRTINAGA